MRPIKLVFCALMGGGGVAACHRKHQTKVKLRWLHLPQPSDQLRFSMPQNLPEVTTVVVKGEVRRKIFIGSKFLSDPN